MTVPRSAVSSACATCSRGATPFGLTGRDEEGEKLEPGRYTLVLRAFPTDGGKSESRSLAFRIR